MFFLKDENTTTKVIHLSDIHIRKIRIKEYKKVFKRTFKKINKLITEKNGLIVVTGDITDNKLVLSPVIIDQIKDFFIGLTNMADTIVILGNHDVAISNKKALDALTPILKKFNTKNKLHLLKENGVYEYNNLSFGLTNIYAKEITKIGKTDKIKIALYHGTIKNSFTETGFKFTNSGHFKISDFTKYYDYGFFGDIHKFQYLDNNKRFAYSSSLIEQRINEASEQHGFIYWDLENKKSHYINIKNNYRYLILKVDNNKIYLENNKVYEKDKIKIKYPKIRLYYKNTNIKKLSEIEETIKKNHKCSEFIKMNDIDEKLNFSYGLNELNNNETISEIKDFETIKLLINGFIKKFNIGWDNNKKNYILNIIENIIKELDEKNYDRKIISLKKIEFSNLFSYGENNILDFDNFGNNKIIGILGNNSFGKSSLIDAILYSIYDKFSRGVNNEALNINENKCYSKIVLNVNNNEFIIERSLKKVGKKITPTLNLYKNGKIITNDRKSSTTQNIYSYICNYEDIVNNNIILQSCENFLDINDVKKRDYLYNILNLDIFNEIIKLVNSKKGSLKSQQFAYTKTFEKYNETEILNKLEEINRSKEKLEKELFIKEEKKKIPINNINELKKNILENINYINKKENKIKILNEQIEKLNLIKKPIEKIENDNFVKEKNRLNSLRDECMKNIVNIQINEIDNLEKIYDNNEQLNLLVIELEKLESEINEIKNKKEKLLKHQYDKNCKYCMMSEITKDKIYYYNIFEELINKKKDVIDKIEILKKQIKPEDTILYDKIKKSNYNIVNLIRIVKQNKINNEKINELNNLIKINNEKENTEYIRNKKICEELNEYENKRNMYIKINKIKKKDLEKLEMEFSKYKNVEIFDLTELTNNIKIINDKLTKLNNNKIELERDLKEIKYLKDNINQCKYDYENYMEINKIIEAKNGLVNYIMNTIILPQIEGKVNNILSLITDYLIELEYDNKRICVYKTEGIRRLKAVNLCGFERFVCNMAFRIVFNQINSKINCNFMIIDEGFSCCDSDNLIKLKYLFDFIRQKYKWCLAITHLDTIKDYFDDTIRINKKNNKSYIN